MSLKRMPAGDQIVEPIEDIVSAHEPDAELALQPEPASHVEHRLGAAARVYAAGVRGHPDAPLDDVREDPLHQRNEIAGVPGAGSRDFCFCMMDIVTSAR